MTLVRYRGRWVSFARNGQAVGVIGSLAIKYIISGCDAITTQRYHSNEAYVILLHRKIIIYAMILVNIDTLRI